MKENVVVVNVNPIVKCMYTEYTILNPMNFEMIFQFSFKLSIQFFTFGNEKWQGQPGIRNYIYLLWKIYVLLNSNFRTNSINFLINYSVSHY